MSKCSTVPMRMITEVVVPAGGIRTRITVPRRRPAGCSGDKRQVKEPNTKVWPTGVITLLRMDARITPQLWCCYCRLVKPFMQRFSALTGYSRTCLHSPCIEKRLAVTPAVRSGGMALLYSRIPSCCSRHCTFFHLGSFILENAASRSHGSERSNWQCPGER